MSVPLPSAFTMRPVGTPPAKMRYLMNCRDCGLMFDAGRSVAFDVRLRCPGCARLVRDGNLQPAKEGGRAAL